MFFAHSTERQDRSDWQPLKEHLENVAARAQSNAAKFDAGELGYLVGLLHDLGKYSPDFQHERLGKEGGRRVDHSTAGAKIADCHYKPLGKLLAFCLAGHHAGLANGASGEAVTALIDRLSNTHIPQLDPLWQEEITLPDSPSPPNSINAIPGVPASSWPFSHEFCSPAWSTQTGATQRNSMTGLTAKGTRPWRDGIGK